MEPRNKKQKNNLQNKKVTKILELKILEFDSGSVSYLLGGSEVCCRRHVTSVEPAVIVVCRSYLCENRDVERWILRWITC